MKDSATLHFLKNFPPWIILLALTILFVGLYFRSGDSSYKDWTSLILASLFTALGVRAAQPAQTGSTTTGDVNITPDLDLTQPEIIGAVENIKENAPEKEQLSEDRLDG